VCKYFCIYAYICVCCGVCDGLDELAAYYRDDVHIYVARMHHHA
jgi:hypothetical protein